MPWTRSVALRLAKWRKSWVVLIVTAAITAIAAVTPLFDFWAKFQVAMHWKPDALAIAKDTEKGNFSRKFVDAAWRRLYSMRRFRTAIEDGHPLAEQEQTWAAYLKALDAWNAELMTNILLLGEYYGADRAHQFEGFIQPAFAELHACMNRLHFRAVYDARGKAACTVGKVEGGSETENVRLLHCGLEQLNYMLYCFASGLSPTGARCKPLNQPIDCRAPAAPPQK